MGAILNEPPVTSAQLQAACMSEEAPVMSLLRSPLSPFCPVHFDVFLCPPCIAFTRALALIFSALRVEILPVSIFCFVLFALLVPVCLQLWLLLHCSQAPL